MKEKFIVEGRFEEAGYTEDNITVAVIEEAWQTLIDSGEIWGMSPRIVTHAHWKIEHGFAKGAKE